MSEIYAWGADTSAHQSSKVDYHKMRLAGATFVILRIGCGKTKDKCFERDYANAIAAGLKVGVYIYSYSTTEAEAIADATRVLGWLNNRHLDFPIALDIEENKQKGANRRVANAKMYDAFRNKIESYGVYDAIIYTGEYFFNNYFDKSLMTDDLWIAKYSSREPNVGRQVSIWQFTSDKVTTDYYNGKLDRNYMFVEKFRGSEPAPVIPTSNPYAVPTRILKKTIPCMRGNDVKWLQTELNRFGYNLVVDGIFGNNTKRCVLDYQSKHGLLVDGKVGPATRYSLING